MPCRSKPEMPPAAGHTGLLAMHTACCTSANGVECAVGCVPMLIVADARTPMAENVAASAQERRASGRRLP